MRIYLLADADLSCDRAPNRKRTIDRAYEQEHEHEFLIEETRNSYFARNGRAVGSALRHGLSALSSSPAAQFSSPSSSASAITTFLIRRA